MCCFIGGPSISGVKRKETKTPAYASKAVGLRPKRSDMAPYGNEVINAVLFFLLANGNPACEVCKRKRERTDKGTHETGPAEKRGQAPLHLVVLADHLVEEAGCGVGKDAVADGILDEPKERDHEHQAAADDAKFGHGDEQDNGARGADLPARRAEQQTLPLPPRLLRRCCCAERVMMVGG